MSSRRGDRQGVQPHHEYVATRKGVELTWQGSVALRDAVKDVARLKNEDGPALVTGGSTCVEASGRLVLVR